MPCQAKKTPRKRGFLWIAIPCRSGIYARQIPFAMSGINARPTAAYVAIKKPPKRAGEAENPLQQGLIFNKTMTIEMIYTIVVIPLKQGLISNKTSNLSSTTTTCRNPFEAGTNFQSSLDGVRSSCQKVAIPLKQGLISNSLGQILEFAFRGRNPFEAGTNFQYSRTTIY